MCRESPLWLVSQEEKKNRTQKLTIIVHQIEKERAVNVEVKVKK